MFRGQNQVPRVFRGCSAGKIKFRGCSVWCSGVVQRAKPSSADVPGLFRGCPAGRIKFHGCSVWCSGVVPRQSQVPRLFRVCSVGKIKFRLLHILSSEKIQEHTLACHPSINIYKQLHCNVLKHPAAVDSNKQYIGTYTHHTHYPNTDTRALKNEPPRSWHSRAAEVRSLILILILYCSIVHYILGWIENQLFSIFNWHPMRKHVFGCKHTCVKILEL